MTQIDNVISEPKSIGKVTVLFAVILASNFLPADLFSPIIVLSGFFLFCLSWHKIKKNYLKIVTPLLGIVILGLIGIVGHESRHILRDISYALSPISLIFIGYWVADKKNMWPHIFKILIFFGIIFSLIHLSQFLLNPDLLNEKFDVIRKEVTTIGGNLIILSLIIGIFQYRLGFCNLFPKMFPRFLALPILCLSFLLSFSRTGLIIGIILCFSILGFVSRINWRSIISIGVLIFGFIFIVFTTPSDEVGTFRSKLVRSIVEITVSDYQDLVDINNNWRGFEAYKAFASFESSSISKKILGQGFGSTINLGFTMNLAGADYDEIPILHNGYAYILVKTGLLGILCYAFFYLSLLKHSIKFRNSEIQDQVLLSRLLLGLTLSLVFSMLVVGGMAEIHDSEFVLLVGYILRRMEQT